MGVFTNIRNLFASNNSASRERRARTGRQLFTDVAVEQVLTFLEGQADPDSVLEEAGLVRADLKPLMADDEIGGAFDTRREMLQARPFNWTGNEVSVDLTEQYIKPHVENVIDGSFKALPFGYSVQEAVWMRIDTGDHEGLIVPRQIVEKPFNWFIPFHDGRLRFSRIGTEQFGQFVDTDFKFFVTKNQPSHVNPYGEALLSRLYWTWFFRTNGIKFWAQYIERAATPWLVGKGKKPDQLLNDLLRAVQDSVIAVKTDDEIDVVNSSTGGIDHEKFEDACNKRIQKLVLGQTGTTEIRPGSGLSASRVMAKVLENKIRADGRRSTRTVQDVTDAFILLNRFNDELPDGLRAAFNDDCPTFSIQTSDKLELERSERDARLMGAGVVLTPEYFQRVYDYEEGEIVEIQSRNASAPPEPNIVPLLGSAFQATLPNNVAQTKTQAMVRALNAVGAPISDSQIFAAIEVSQTVEDLEQRFVRMLEPFNDPNLTEQFSNALFQIDAEGYVDES